MCVPHISFRRLRRCYTCTKRGKRREYRLFSSAQMSHNAHSFITSYTSTIFYVAYWVRYSLAKIYTHASQSTYYYDIRNSKFLIINDLLNKVDVSEFAGNVVVSLLYAFIMFCAARQPPRKSPGLTQVEWKC